MLRFIIFCMAFIAVSFFAVPIYFGISKTHDQLAQTITSEAPSDSLTFEEIYTLVDAGIMDDPTMLNNIEPAAGEQVNTNLKEGFSLGFSDNEDSALADDVITESSSL